MSNIVLLLELEDEIESAIRENVPQAEIDLLIIERDKVQKLIDETPR